MVYGHEACSCRRGCETLGNYTNSLNFKKKKSQIVVDFWPLGQLIGTVELFAPFSILTLSACLSQLALLTACLDERSLHVSGTALH